MGDVTYGACCVDDLSADTLGADFIIHYGHSCLVPIDETCIKAMYVFVEISIDIDHFIATIELNFPTKTQGYSQNLSLIFTDHYRLMIMGTIQFNTALFTIKKALEEV
jgi:2-(3-amino-3-carboxypropyl)histidine synthase